MGQQFINIIFCVFAFLVNMLKLTSTTEIDYSDVEVISPCTQCEMVHTNDLFETISPVLVNVTLIILKMDFVSLDKMEIEITTLLNAEWEDFRIENNDKTKSDAVNGKIWEPLITLTEGRFTNRDENEIVQYWRANNHHVLHNTKKSFIVQCSRYFKHYPFDTQECLIKWSSYRFSIDEVLLMWTNMPIQIQTLVQLHDFDVVNVQTYSEVDVRPSGNFSVIVVKLTVKRRYERIILCKFIPVVLLLIMSYTTFWITFPYVFQFRFYVSVLPVISEIFLYSSVSCSVYSPKLTALDIWYLGCMILSFYAFIHTILIGYLKYLATLNFESITPSAPPATTYLMEYERSKKGKTSTVTINSSFAPWFDNIMIFLFPTLTITLFVIYCALYISYKVF